MEGESSTQHKSKDVTEELNRRVVCRHDLRDEWDLHGGRVNSRIMVRTRQRILDPREAIAMGYDEDLAIECDS